LSKRVTTYSKRDGKKCAYTRPHGDGRRWDVFDAGYAKLLEIPVKTAEEAVEFVKAMALDGSLERLINERHASRTAAVDSFVRWEADRIDDHLYKKARDGELRPGPSSFDGLDRPAIPMRRETHRLLRAVAIKRAKKIPGEVPSIGSVIEELVQRHHTELEREAGALFKRELAKKR
jgi:hypothetical protein